MILYRAQESDSEFIKEFYHRQILAGHINYRIERPGSFFDSYRLISDDFITFLMKDNDGQIQAMASIVFRRGYLNHQDQSTAFVTDLRVAPSRKAILYWAQLFIPALRREVRSRDCEFLFSTLEHFENQAYNALIRPKNRKSFLPRYHLFRKFDIIALAGRSPFRQSPLETIDIRQGQPGDIEEVSDYLKEKSVGRPLFHPLSPDELEKRCQNWPNFSMSNFLVARNSNKKIIGCMAPWNNQDCQQWIVESYHGKSQRAFQTTQTLSTFRLLKPLPAPGDRLQTQWVTHGAYDNSDIFFTLIEKAYNQTQRNEFLMFPNFTGEFKTQLPLGYFGWKIPFGFYTLLNKDQPLPTILRPNPFVPPPDYEYFYF